MLLPTGTWIHVRVRIYYLGTLHVYTYRHQSRDRSVELIIARPAKDQTLGTKFHSGFSLALVPGRYLQYLPR